MLYLSVVIYYVEVLLILELVLSLIHWLVVCLDIPVLRQATAAVTNLPSLLFAYTILSIRDVQEDLFEVGKFALYHPYRLATIIEFNWLVIDLKF